VAYNVQIERAIAHLKEQNSLNILATARELSVIRETLYKRFHRKTTSRAQAAATYKIKLSIRQEKVLVAYINKLSDYGLSSILRIIRNLIKELLKFNININ
jgi:hypothetical protein